VPSENEIRWPELDRDMIGFERKFKAELTKMRKDVEYFFNSANAQSSSSA